MDILEKKSTMGYLNNYFVRKKMVYKNQYPIEIYHVMASKLFYYGILQIKGIIGKWSFSYDPL